MIALRRLYTVRSFATINDFMWQYSVINCFGDLSNASYDRQAYREAILTRDH
jgi:hypothetical protein